MDPRAIRKAESRLRAAEDAITRLYRAPNIQRFGDNWYIFFAAAKNIYTVLETGSKTSPRSMQWFGGKVRERIGDELLHYVYQARNDDEHGLGVGVEEHPGHIRLGVNKPGFATSIVVNGSLETGLMITSLDKKPILNEIVNRHPILVPVDARGNLTINPPATHLGQSLADNLPLTVARLAYVYLTELVSEAARLV